MLQFTVVKLKYVTVHKKVDDDGGGDKILQMQYFFELQLIYSTVRISK